MIDLERIAGFDWDAGNTWKNRKHGVTPAEAEQVFFCERLLLLEDVAHSQHEPRFHALGQTFSGRGLHVTFTLRADNTRVRVISARDMHRKERAIYDEKA